MTFDPNDPRLTAYVLGELEPAECAEVDAMLNDSPECRQAVDEIRLTVGCLTDRLHEEQAAHAVTPETNHRPVAAVLPPAAAPVRSSWRRSRLKLGAVAALILGAVTLALIPMTMKRLRQDEAFVVHLADAGPDVQASKASAPAPLLKKAAPAPVFNDGSVAFVTDGQSTSPVSNSPTYAYKSAERPVPLLAPMRPQPANPAGGGDGTMMRGMIGTKNDTGGMAGMGGMGGGLVQGREPWHRVMHRPDAR